VLKLLRQLTTVQIVRTVITAELDDIQTWAYLHHNRAKCVEIVFSQTRRRRPIDPPPPLPDITRVSTIKILSVTITNKLPVSSQYYAPYA